MTFEAKTVFFNLLSLDVATALAGGREWVRGGRSKGG